jgi:hypothetical protein
LADGPGDAGCEGVRRNHGGAGRTLIVSQRSSLERGACDGFAALEDEPDSLAVSQESWLFDGVTIDDEKVG